MLNKIRFIHQNLNKKLKGLRISQMFSQVFTMLPKPTWSSLPILVVVQIFLLCTDSLSLWIFCALSKSALQPMHFLQILSQMHTVQSCLTLFEHTLTHKMTFLFLLITFLYLKPKISNIKQNFDLFVCLFNGISTFLHYLMPKPSFLKNSSDAI